MATGNVHRKYDEVWICGSGLCTCKVYVSLPCATCCMCIVAVASTEQMCWKVAIF